MNINIHNYEAYFLDYHEGNLSLDLIKELMEFLSHHPELREEFESFEPVTIQDTEEVIFHEKEALKKNNGEINPAGFDELAIEHVEGTLSANEQQALKAFIAKNPQYARELELYTKTKLVADNAIIFEDKSSLRKGTKRPVASYYWSAAASVAIIIGAYFILNRSTTPGTDTIVQHTLPKDSNTVARGTVKAIDTTANKNPFTTLPTVYKVAHNHIVAVRTEQKRVNSKNENVTPRIPVKDSAIVATGETPKHQMEPVKELSPVPALPENNLPVAQSNHVADTSAKQPLIVMKDDQPEAKKKKSNFLAMLKLKGWCVIRDLNQI